MVIGSTAQTARIWANTSRISIHDMRSLLRSDCHKLVQNGVVEQSNFGDFVVLRITDMPQIAVHIVHSAEPPAGMGEPDLPPLAPAFANAMARLTGKPLRELPLKIA